MKPIFGDLKSQGLKLKDIIIYITIRFLCNIEYDGYTPTLSYIQSMSECSAKAITKSIKRLKRAKYLKYDKDALENGYTFNNKRTFQKVSSDILCEDGLTRKEKAILLILHENNVEGFAGVGTEIAEESGLYLKGFKRHYQSLLNKGYIFEDYDCFEGERLTLVIIPDDELNLGTGEVYKGSDIDVSALNAK